MSTSTNMYSSNQLGGYSSLQTRKRDLDMINDLSRNSNTSLFSPAAGEPYFPVNNNRQRDNYAPPQFTDSVNPYAAPMVHFEQQPVLCIRSMPPSLDTDRGENLNQVSPKAKRHVLPILVYLLVLILLLPFNMALCLKCIQEQSNNYRHQNQQRLQL